MSSDVRGLSLDRIPPPKRRLGTRVVLPLALVAAAIGTVLFATRDALWPVPGVRVEPVVPAPGGAASAPGGFLTAPGWIAPDPFPIHVVARTDGILEEMLALEGERVEKDQVVARLVPDDARIERDRARALRDRDRAALDAVAAEKATVPAAVAAAEAAITATREELRLKRPLADAGTLSASEIARLEARLAAESAALDVARARDTVLAAREAEARAQLAIAEADVAAAELRLSRTEVRAPTAGVVLRRYAMPGTVVGRPGSSTPADVLDLYDPARLLVRTDVPFADAARVDTGQRAIVTVEALPDRELEGRVVRAVQEADTAKNTVAFHVALDEVDPALRPEMIARVRLFATAPAPDADPVAAAALFVPRRALRGDRVLVVVDVDGDNGTITARTPELGAERDDFVEVRSGLRAGDRVVVDGPADLEDGQRVRVLGEGEAR